MNIFESNLSTLKKESFQIEENSDGEEILKKALDIIKTSDKRIEHIRRQIDDYFYMNRIREKRRIKFRKFKMMVIKQNI